MIVPRGLQIVFLVLGGWAVGITAAVKMFGGKGKDDKEAASLESKQ